MLPDWLALGLAIAGFLSIVFAAIFLLGEQFFPARRVQPSPHASGEWKRRREIRSYLDAIGERYVEDASVDGESPAFYLPERDVAITFDAHAYFRLEAAGRYAVLVEHEMPGVHLGARLPFETPRVGAESRTSDGPRSARAGHRGTADSGPGSARSRWADSGTGRRAGAGRGRDRRAGRAAGERAGSTADDAGGAMTVRDALSVLEFDPGPGRDPDSELDREALRAAYRSRIKEAHPDQGGDVEEFERVQTAYATARRAT